MPEEVKPETSCSNKQEIENKKFRLSFNDILYIRHITRRKNQHKLKQHCYQHLVL